MDRETNHDKWRDGRDNLGQPTHSTFKEKEFEEVQKIKWFGQVSESESGLKLLSTLGILIQFSFISSKEATLSSANYRRTKV